MQGTLAIHIIVRNILATSFARNVRSYEEELSRQFSGIGHFDRAF